MQSKFYQKLFFEPCPEKNAFMTDEPLFGIPQELVKTSVQCTFWKKTSKIFEYFLKLKCLNCLEFVH